MTLNKESLERLWQHIIARLGQKVDKEEGKGLSSCDFTAEEKEKLKGLETNARADWNETDPTSASYIVNTPTEVGTSVIVKWDGVITEDTPVIEQYNTFYKVSNYNNTDPSKISGITAYIPGQGEIFLPLNEGSLDFTEQDGISTLICDYFIIASAPIEPYVPEAGTYLMYMSEQRGYIKALNGKINVVKEENISKKIARLTDLPCGEMPGGIYWDGDITNKESVQIEEGINLYKISEETPDKESLVGKKLGFTSPDGYQELSIVPGYIISFNEDLFKVLESFVVVASKETTLEGVGTLSPGVYFVKYGTGDESTYVSYLETDNFIKMLDEKYIPDTIARKKDIPTPVQSDWNVSDENDLAYIKNKPFDYGSGYFKYEYNGNLEDYEYVEENDAIFIKVGEALSEDTIKTLSAKNPIQMEVTILTDDNETGTLPVIFYQFGTLAVYVGTYLFMPSPFIFNVIEETSLGEIMDSDEFQKTLPKGLYFCSEDVRSFTNKDIKKINQMFLPDSGDWEEDNTDNYSYIKNRTHYEKYKTYTFDGNYESYEHIEIQEGVFYVKISEDVLTLKDFNGLRATIIEAGIEVNDYVSSEDVSVDEENGVIFASSSIIIAPTEATLQNFVLTPGIWVIYQKAENLSVYISKIKFITGIEQLDEKFIPDTIARISDLDSVQVEAITNDQIDALFEDGFFPPLPNANGVNF